MKRIKNLRNKLHKSIKKFGINSDETRKISDELDILINEYYESIQEVEYPLGCEMKLYYDYSYKLLKSTTQQLEKFPTTKEWNKFAKNNYLLSNTSMQYISKLNWNYLRTKVLRELKKEL